MSVPFWGGAEVAWTVRPGVGGPGAGPAKPEPSRPMASIRSCRRVASDAGERSPPHRANQTSMAAFPHEMTEPARARR